MLRPGIAVLLLACAVLLPACASAPPVTAESVVFAPTLRVDLEAMERLPAGLLYRDLRVGEGEPARAGRRVAIHYVGWLPDGTQIDGQAPPSPPIEFRLGSGEVIRGWEQGIPGMRVGGQRMLIVPPAQAYGRNRVGRVPPNSVLVFVVDLASAR